MLPNLSPYAPFLLIASGFAAEAWLVSRISKPLGTLVTAGGVVLGFLSILASISGYLGGKSDIFTLAILGLVGICILLKPLRNVRWAALIALIAGAGAVYILQSIFQLSNTVLIVVFLAIAFVSYLVFKFAEEALRLVGSILTFPPVSILIGLVSIFQGILILVGRSLTQFLR